MNSLTGDMKGGEHAGVDICWYNPLHQPNTSDITVTCETDSLAKLSEFVLL